MNGNTGTCTATVTVEDTVPPVAVCLDVTVQLDGSGNASIVPGDIDNGSSDVCGVDSLALNVSTFSCADVGANAVTLTVFDVNGNVASCGATVTIEDTVPPIATCQDITVQLDGAGNATISAMDVDGGSTDNCSVDSLTVAPTSFSCANVGANSVTLTVSDVNGNMSSCIATVTIEDTVPPMAVCQDITVQLDGSGNASITPGDIDNGSSDACGVDSLSLDVSAFTCSNVGANSVSLTVYDVNGNTASCSATVTIEDTVPPVAVCADITVQLDGAGNATIVPGDIDNGSNDACGIDSLSVDITSFTCGDIGSNTVTLTVFDANGNSATCTGNVTVEDNLDPNAVCRPYTAYLDATGNVTVLADSVDGGSNDNCGIASLSLTPNTFTCNEIGVNLVTLTVTDSSGGTDNCFAVVTVEDTIPPSAVCKDVTLFLDINGNASLSGTDLNNGSADACGIDSLNASQTSFTCTDIPNTTVTLTVVDDNGNSSTCTSVVTVNDSFPPLALCRDITVQLDAAGNASITANDINNGSADACGIDSLTISPSVFTCSNVGANTVTLTAFDNNGNSSSCTGVVTIEDTVPPVAICQDVTVQLDSTGNATVMAGMINNGSNDACGIDSLVVTPTAFNCSNVGANTVTLTALDVNGNSSTCSATVTVEDTVPPIALCMDITVQLDSTGNTSIVAGDVDGGSSDNCGVDSLSIDIASFTCSNVGSNSVTLTVFDVNGNVSSCGATVTVEDMVPPVASCQDITVQLDASGNATITAADVDGGSSDNCGVDTLMVAPSTFTCSEIGNNVVTLTVTDQNGNTDTCLATVTVEDTISPVANCQNITVFLDAAGSASIDAVDVDGGSTDACGVDSLSVSPSTFGCTEVGANAVVLTVTDNNGNNSTCTGQVMVMDTVPPVAVCTDITVELDSSGSATIVAGDVDGGSSDACGIDSLSISPTTFTCSATGSNIVTLTVTDNNGNTATCTATVSINDTVPPDALCRNLTVFLDGTGNTSITPGDVDNGSSDACGIDSLSIDVSTFSCADLGNNLVTLTVTDNNGNMTSCTSLVTVRDTTPPTAVCQDITLQLDAAGNASYVAADIDGGSTDNCAVDSLTATPTSFTCANVGMNTVTLIVEDGSGNSSTCTATVTVEDTVPPVAVCQDITIQLDAAGNASITPGDVNAGSSDNCSVDSLTLNQSSFTCANVGMNTVTLTVLDANGNSNSCTATVMVMDTVAPVAVCQDVTVQLDGSGNGSITPMDIDNGSSDACGVDSLALDITAFNCSNVGANVVTLAVFDVNGNTSTCMATITIEDTVPPIAVCQDITIQLDGGGNASITAGDVDGGSSDNCGIDSLSIDIASFTCADLGANSVTLTVTDLYGQSSSCVATVSVEDDIDPVAVCQDLTVYLDTAGTVTVPASAVDNGSSDNCGVTNLTLTPNTFTCTDVGNNLVTLVVSDTSGNTDNCFATVQVLDTIPPTAVCQDITIYLDAFGFAPITAVDIDAGSSDACGISTRTAVPTLFDCAKVGPNTVVLTVQDNNNNVDSCTSIVTVVDSIAPTAVCQDITVQVGSTGSATITPMDIDNGSSDICGIDSLSLDINSFTCADVGNNTVTLTITDVNGNVSSCGATVTVEDNVPPVALCQDLTVGLDSAGSATITPLDVNAGSSDVCGIDSLVISQSNFGCGDTGPNTVTLTVTDVNGNVSTCTSTVTVIDSTPPVLSGCPSNVNQGVDTGFCGALITWTAPTFNDNCSIDSTFMSHNSGDFFQVGTTTVSIQIFDPSGNADSCSFTITITDDEAPLISGCPSDNTLDNDPGVCGAVATWTPPTVFDNCGVASFTSTHNPGDLFPIGTTTVTYLALDSAGNADTCSFTITVNDTEAPVIAGCPADQIVGSDSGQCGAVVNWTAPTASDNCGIVSFTSTDSSGTFFPVGMTTVAYLAIDSAGNADTCSFSITVNDTEAPVIAGCPVDQTVGSDSGQCGAVVTWTAPTASDNCGIASFTSTDSSGTFFPVGNTTVTYIALDSAGNVDTCSFIITVNDTEAPLIAGCPIDQTVGSDSGQCGAVVTWTVPTASDNCGIASFTTTDSSGTFFPVGMTMVTYVAMDSAGNADTCSFTVTVNDTEAPVIAGCPIDQTVGSDGGQCGAVVTWTIPTASDNCGIAVFTFTDSSGTFFGIGTHTVTYLALDSSGNADTCSFTITVNDTEAPVIAGCPSDQTVSNDSGQCGAAVAWTLPTASDNCGIASFTSTDSSGTFFPVGMTTVIYLAQDSAGNADTCSFTLTVIDTEAPVITGCPIDQTVGSDSGQCGAVVTWTAPSASDNCGIASFTSTDSSGTFFPVGTTTVTYLALDSAGNLDTCSFTITVNDTEAPVITGCPSNTTVSNDSSQCGAIVNWTAPTATDNCGIASFTSTDSSGTFFPLGTTTVAYLAVDSAGNLDSCSFTITVNDTEAPVITGCPTDITTVNDPGLCGAVVTWAEPLASDNCAIASFSSTDSSGTFFPGGTTTILYVAIDSSGNVDSCSFTITVTDNEPPVLACPMDITQDTDPGVCEAVVTWMVPNVTDNCAMDTVVATHQPGDTFGLGTTMVTYIAIDSAGNADTCSFTVTIEDNEGPLLICPADTVVANDPGFCGAVVNYTPPVGIDNCSGATTVLTGGGASGGLFPLGVASVTYTSTDSLGNSSVCTFTITVVDSEPPVITCPMDTVISNDLGQCAAVYSFNNATFTDNCPGTSVALTGGLPSGSNFPVGINLVTFTATDGAGNQDSCTFSITVQDTEVPLISCPVDVTISNDTGSCDAVYSYTTPIATDNCVIDSVFQVSGIGSGGTFPFGVTTEVWVAVDTAGNLDTCAFTVTVLDNENPVAVCQDITAQLDGTGMVIITGNDVDGGSSDNCQVASLTVSPAMFGCSNTGPNTVTLTVTDSSGNASTCSATVTVQDTIAPMAVCMDITLQLGHCG